MLLQDREAWLNMRHRLWPGDPQAHAQDVDAYFAGNSKCIDQAFCFEIQGGSIAGFVELRVRNYAEGSSNHEVPFLEGWYVEPHRRGQGIGKQLIARSIAWAQRLGYAELASNADLENEGGIAAHISLGFTEVERTVSFLKRW